MNLIAPLSTTPLPGLAALSPTGIIIAPEESTFTVLPDAGCNTRLLPAVVLIVLLVMVVLSFMFMVPSVFISPLVSTLPLELVTLNNVPTLKLLAFTVAVSYTHLTLPTNLCV